METAAAEGKNVDSPDDAASLLLWLRERDAECPLCRYNLRGLTVPRCPECGNGLKLSVSLIDPYVAAWVTLAVVIRGSAGLGFLLLCIILRAGMPGEGVVDACMFFFIATIPLPVVLLKTRRRFQRLSRSMQWCVTIVASIPSALAMAILCAALR